MILDEDRIGELLEISIYTEDMRVNNPVPWIGMPIYYLDTRNWYIVGQNATNTEEAWLYEIKSKNRTGVVLRTYKRHATTDLDSKFILPGQSNAPKMSTEFNILFSELLADHSYYTNPSRDNLLWRKKNDMWISGPENQDKGWGDGLLLPDGIESERIFRNNGLPSSKISNDIKSLREYNSDGRTICYKCKQSLKTVEGFTSNFTHCPECEK